MAVFLCPSLFIENEMEDGMVRFPAKGKGQYIRIAFCVNLAKLFIRSYLITPSKVRPFKNTRTSFCFSSIIDENTDTVPLIE